jgi:hypothetical protein
MEKICIKIKKERKERKKNLQVIMKTKNKYLFIKKKRRFQTFFL